jgi:hypothetical protein
VRSDHAQDVGNPLAIDVVLHGPRFTR